MHLSVHEYVKVLVQDVRVYLEPMEELDLVSYMYNIDFSNFSYYQLTVMCQQYIYCEFNVIFVRMIGKPELQL